MTPEFQINELQLYTVEARMGILETSLSLPVGQSVVVGSARLRNDAPTIILVVRHLDL
jgi:hypothetical protein